MSSAMEIKARERIYVIAPDDDQLREVADLKAVRDLAVRHGLQLRIGDAKRALAEVPRPRASHGGA